MQITCSSIIVISQIMHDHIIDYDLTCRGKTCIKSNTNDRRDLTAITGPINFNSFYSKMFDINPYYFFIAPQRI